MKPADAVAIKFPDAVTLPKLSEFESVCVIVIFEPESSTAGEPPETPLVATLILPLVEVIDIPFLPATRPKPLVVTSPLAEVMYTLRAVIGPPTI
jgi:hypothetical protein